MNSTYELSCYFEQENLIADHLFYGAKLGVLPIEKERIAKYLSKVHPGGTLTKAELIMEDAKWVLHVN